MAKKRRLTEKQKIFCNEYLIDLNATRAYKVAYPNVTRDETAAAAASRLLRNVKVKAYIDERMKEREKRTEVTQDKVLKELAKIGFANTTDYVNVTEKECEENITDEDGKIIGTKIKRYQFVEIYNTDELDEDKKSAIAEIKQGKDGIELKLHDKVKTLELMGRHLGMFIDKTEITGNLNTNNPFQGLTTEELKKLIK